MRSKTLGPGGRLSTTSRHEPAPSCEPMSGSATTFVSMPHRLMADPVFLAAQRAALRDPHIAPITDLVDRLRTGGRWAPYVAPLHGGVGARVISILRDPGPKTTDDAGSGMLCVENDDPTAELQATLMDAPGLPFEICSLGMRTPGTSTGHRPLLRCEKGRRRCLSWFRSCPV